MLVILCFALSIIVPFVPAIAENFLFPVEPAALSSEDISLQEALSIAKHTHENEIGCVVLKTYRITLLKRIVHG